jgi:hypothetical protein
MVFVSVALGRNIHCPDSTPSKYAANDAIPMQKMLTTIIILSSFHPIGAL